MVLRMQSMLGHCTAGIRRSSTAVLLAVLVVISSSCIVLVQDDTFAIGTESYRANLVIYVETTDVLDVVRREYGTQVARDLVLSQAPPSLSLPGPVMAVLCSANPALCVAGDYVPDLVPSWFRSDVRNRSDFGTNLSSAAGQDECFAWTIVPSRNFTEKPVGNSAAGTTDHPRDRGATTPCTPSCSSCLHPCSSSPPVRRRPPRPTSAVRRRPTRRPPPSRSLTALEDWCGFLAVAVGPDAGGPERGGRPRPVARRR